MTDAHLLTDKVIATYREPRESLRTTAAKHGVSHETVRQILLRNGEPVRAWGVTGKWWEKS